MSIKVTNINKQYGETPILKDVSFSLGDQESLGIIGRNGTGKTTLINILIGLDDKYQGNVNYSFNVKDFAKKIGIQMQDGSFEQYVKVDETCKLFCDLYHLDYSRMDELIKLFDLEKVKKTYLTKLSGGEKQKVNLLLALLHNPDLLFFDEITTGLDALSRENILGILSNIRKENKSLIIVSHYFEEIFRLCDKVLILDKGKTLYYGKVKDIGKNETAFNKHILGMMERGK